MPPMKLQASLHLCSYLLPVSCCHGWNAPALISGWQTFGSSLGFYPILSQGCNYFYYLPLARATVFFLFRIIFTCTHFVVSPNYTVFSSCCFHFSLLLCKATLLSCYRHLTPLPSLSYSNQALLTCVFDSYAYKSVFKLLIFLHGDHRFLSEMSITCQFPWHNPFLGFLLFCLTSCSFSLLVHMSDNKSKYCHRPSPFLYLVLRLYM